MGGKMSRGGWVGLYGDELGVKATWQANFVGAGGGGERHTHAMTQHHQLTYPPTLMHTHWHTHTRTGTRDRCALLFAPAPPLPPPPPSAPMVRVS